MILSSDPRRLIEVSFGGKTFKASQATYGNLLDTQTALAHQHPGATIEVIQPCFNVGVALSAGTHDKDAVLDVAIRALSWPDAQKFLRQQGWAAWWRHTGSWAAASAWHIHMVSLGAVKAGNPVGIFIPGQIIDYHNHAEGLAGEHTSGDDPTWHPANIAKTIFNYHSWWEDDMPYSNWPDADKKALAHDVAAAVTANVLDAPMNSQPGKQGDADFAGANLRQTVKSIARAVNPKKARK